MIASQRDGQNWWKIEPKYSTKVLIGNWVEERERFRKGTGKPGSSIYKTDFICFPDHKPDKTLRRIVMEKHEGLPMQHFFTHHEEPRSQNLVSEYDDKYNRHGYNPVLPPLHSWNGRKLAWIPQKSDFPILEPPTNYGLLEHLMKKWHEEEAGVMNSVYTISYEIPLISSFVTCQLRQPAKIHDLPSNQGHLLQTVSRILGYEGDHKYLQAIGNW
ncbi:cilia- and flagella-associated protein 107 [Larus michahellis]|uniref:cilia- and flagella-associated protein 107 n=1 Tax=Larus michahellis TaxID=119627 RepID=UPI003D9B6959